MTGSRGASWVVQMMIGVCRRDTTAGSFLLKCLAVEQFPEHIFSSHHQAAELFVLLSISPSALSCHFSWLQAWEDNTLSAVVSPSSPAFPSHLQGGVKWFLQDEELQLSGWDASAKTVFHERSITGGPAQELGSVIDLREIQERVLRPWGIFKAT